MAYLLRNTSRARAIAAASLAALVACEVVDKGATAKVDTVVVRDQRGAAGVAPAPAAGTTVRTPARVTPTPAAPAAPAAAGATTAGSATAAGTGTVTLRNASYDSVNVEVRLGSRPNCEDNTSFGTRLLRRGDTWTVTTAQDVCWRRDADPAHPNGQWSQWSRQAVSAGTHHEAAV